LLDRITTDPSEKLSFAWRRNSNLENTGKFKNGKEIRSYIRKEAPWEIDTPLTRQIPQEVQI
jgi:hypothetical protein